MGDRVAEDLAAGCGLQRDDAAQNGPDAPHRGVGVAAGDQQQPPAGRPDPPPVGRHVLPVGADGLRVVDVVEDQEPPIGLLQLLPHQIRQSGPPRPRFLEPGFGKPTGQRGADHLLGQLLSIAPADPEHGPAFHTRDVGQGGSQGGLADPTHPAHHGVPPLGPGQQPPKGIEFAVTAADGTGPLGRA